MAEIYEYDAIMSRMLALVPSSVDKREGSIIYSALSPCAFELSVAYYMLTYLASLLFADTSEGEWLDRVVADFGITREAATYAVRQINTFDANTVAFDVPIGARFGINELTFAVTEKIAIGQFKAACEQAGLQGNNYSGDILPLDNVNNLASATLVANPLITGTDEETDDSLKTRFYEYAQQSAYGGNIADYEQKTLAVTGVGAVKVFNSVAMGTAGHVGILVGDDSGNKASQTLVDTVQTLMGVDGSGIAPIGHTVTVGTSTDLTVNVAASVILKTGSSFATAQPIVTQTITDYINSIGFNDTIVYYAKLVADILNCNDAIVDVGTVTINGASTNLSLTKTFANYQVPVVGTVTVTEVA